MPLAVLYVSLSIAPVEPEWVAEGTSASADSLMSAPVNAFEATFDPFTALRLIFARVTAFAFSCLEPTLRAGNEVAA